MKQVGIKSFFNKAARYEVLADKDKTMDEIQRKNEQRTQEEYNNKRKFEGNKRDREMENKRKQREFEKLSKILLDDPSTSYICIYRIKASYIIIIY